jgi:hypothetical protein
MQAFNAVLNAADPLLQQGDIDLISVDFAKTILAEHISITVREADI